MSVNYIIPDVNSKTLYDMILDGKIKGIFTGDLKEGSVGLWTPIDPKQALKRQVEIANFLKQMGRNISPDDVTSQFPTMDSVWIWLDLDDWEHSNLTAWGANTSMAHVILDKILDGLSKAGIETDAISEHEDEYWDYFPEDDEPLEERLNRALGL